MPEPRRTVRKRAFLAAYACSAQGQAFCLVRDVSPSGARLELSEGAALPATFDLQISGRDRVYRAEIVWRRSHQVGIRFLARTPLRQPLRLSQAS